jgi:hypothetical protein
MNRGLFEEDLLRKQVNVSQVSAAGECRPDGPNAMKSGRFFGKTKACRTHLKIMQGARAAKLRVPGD